MLFKGYKGNGRRGFEKVLKLVATSKEQHKKSSL
jgi:hypothetical protein